MARYGLISQQGVVSLEKVDASFKILESHAEVTIVQKYQNTSETPVEASFVFPLEQGSAVCEFEAKIGDKVLLGQCLEKQKAAEKYDDAIASGGGAYMLKKDREDVFSLFLGNLLPKTQVELRFVYSTNLQSIGKNASRFFLPAVVTARYTPAGEEGVVSHLSAPVTLSLKGVVEMPFRIKSIDQESSHELKKDIKGCKANIEFEGVLEKDLLFTITTSSGERELESWAESWENKGEKSKKLQQSLCVMMKFCPDFSSLFPHQTPHELIFLIDRSGSMSGSRIAQAASSLQLFLRSLPMGCRFNLIGFGTNFKELFPTSQDYTEKTLATASQYAAKLDASFGGTEILKPLSQLLKTKAKTPREIIVLTDGEVSNESSVLTNASTADPNTRIFSLGIGNGVSTSLVKGLAERGRGVAEFVVEGERIEPKVMRLLQLCLAHKVSSLKVDWKGLIPSHQSPSNETEVVLMDGEKTTLFGILPLETLPKPLPNHHEVILTANVEGKAYKKSIAISLEEVRHGKMLHVLAVQSLIKELQAKGGKREEVVELSTRFGVLSQETSYLVVEYRDEPSGLSMQQAIVKPVVKSAPRSPSLQRSLSGSGSCSYSCSGSGSDDDDFDDDEEEEEEEGDGSSKSRSTSRSLGSSFGSELSSSFPEEQEEATAGAFQEARRAPEVLPKSKKDAKAPERKKKEEVKEKKEKEKEKDGGRNQKSGESKQEGAEKKKESPLQNSRYIFQSLVQLQQAEGSWMFSTALTNLLFGNGEEKVKQQLGSVWEKLKSSEKEKVEKVVATIMATFALEVYFPNFEDEWKFLKSKAEKWIANQMKTLFGSQGDDLIDFATLEMRKMKFL